jgi:curli biogenesis system outer membrane secretion channel CsgG
MKKLWSIVLLIGLVNAQMPEPTMVGQDELRVPTLSINNFVNQAEIEGLEDSRVFLGITNILTENVMDSRYDLIEGGSSDFELTARVVYLGRPRTSTTILGLFRRETSTTEVRVVVELLNKKTGKVASGNGTGTIDREISSTGFQISEDLPFDRSELGGALKEAIGNAVQEIL